MLGVIEGSTLRRRLVLLVSLCAGVGGGLGLLLISIRHERERERERSFVRKFG